MNTNDEKRIPIWGWPILFLFLFASGLLLSYIGSDFIVAYAHWSDAIWWGILTAVALAGSLWCARVESSESTLIIAAIFFLFIAVNTQINYYKKSKFEIFTVVQNSEDSEWPSGWKNLNRDTLYQNFIKHRIKPTGLAWLDHLRLQADIGVVRTEQQGHRKYGGRKGVEVYRHGFWMWWGWFVCHLFLAIGCFFGTAGSAFVAEKKEKKSDVSEIVLERMTINLKEKGLDEESIKSILNRPRNKRAEITDREILELLPIDNNEVAREIVDIVKLSKTWKPDVNTEQDLKQSDVEKIHSLLAYYYNQHPREVKNIYANNLTLLAADKLDDFLKHKSFYDCLLIINDISELLSFHPRLSPFHRIDLSGIHYKALTVGELWQPLYEGRQSFYSYNSTWELLENNKAEDIPEDAYLAIIYQYFHQPDPRGYEMWQGTVPSEFITLLSPGLRDAILTWLSVAIRRSSISSGTLSWHMQLASRAADWPQHQAAEFLERCKQSGWRRSFERLPDTPFWRNYIDRNHKTPFGDLGNYLDWYQ